ncbi:MAG: hypothetical protein KZQ97_16810 [Candidatus Thiodiazotropha sp. (ex Dulcina madagascariensis)]|nr:hypothetical protein [Candidatus Thiodiazotropha sp. (ex Dulcina madagascariensis)]
MTELRQTTDEIAEAEPQRSGFSLQSLLTLPVLLRGAGSMVLIAALSIFLFQHWDSGNDLQRYWMLLGFNTILAFTGFASGRILGEAKGARTFLMLALAAIPINFTILGAFVYTWHPLDNLSASYPEFAFWHIADSVPLAIPLIAGVVVAMIVSWLGFLVLARRSALRLAAFSLLANAALLIPVRSADNIAWLLLILVPALAYATLVAIRANPGLKTFEGRIAKLLVWIPVGLILGRTLWLYSISTFLILILFVMTWALLRILAQTLTRQQVWRQWIEHLSLVAGVGIALSIASLAVEHWGVETTTAIHLFAYTLAGLTIELSLRASSSRITYRQIAALTLIAAPLLALSLYGSAANAALCMGNGLAILAFGYIMEKRFLLALGLIAFLAGLGFQIWHAIVLFDLGGWGSLAALGTLSILAGSVVEKFGTLMKQRLNGFAGKIREWES